ncbi:DEAD/DEAH box helicase [Sphingopyxis sp. MC1]|uniref:DEAD/DEAH box helicase n=1 Tax=Sphingopyxis sp. MC1 TaxID=1174684 RepID=UPI0002D15A7D|nr:DEAD/DEAH box helicase [Sphingopyxis sp. MC1]ENY82808.1 non-specific serine/threonine protein kinase [Sphingopyxis sp. MC1]MBN2973544.1 DEAD/DEAH box helicase [Roseomonas aeriglobus]
MRRWILSGRTLGLGDGTIDEIPDPDSAYGSLVERRPVWPDVEPGMTGDATPLKASRYPIVVRLVLDLVDGAPATRIVGEVRGRSFDLEPADLDHGHCVIDGVWYPLEPVSRAEVAASAAGTSIGPLHSARQLLDLKKAAAGDGAVEDRTSGVAIPPLLLAGLRGGAPGGVNAVLYPYQADGWRWLGFLLGERIGGFLADEMGLGKTLQVISVVSDPGPEPLGQVLVVAPGSLLENWCREFRKFAPAVRVLKHHGPRRTGRPADLAEWDVVVTSYDNVVRDQSLLQMIEWGAVVIDEAQNIRNPDAIRTRSVKRLRRRSGIAVTGTPVENRLMDLWSIMDFVIPGYLGTSVEFERQFGDDHDGAASLEPFVSPVMLRRRVADVAQDLPDRIDIPQVVELDEAEARAYEAIRLRIAAEYGQAATLVSLTLLRQFCAHPMLLERAASGDPMDFSKFARLDELLAEIFALGEKAIIFTSYNRMSDIIQNHVRRRHGAFTGAIDGRLPIPERQPLLDRFSEIEGAAVLILNPRAGGAGLNITAANHVIHYNLEWNPALEDQASARAYRRGQERPVTVHRLFVADTVEEVVDERLTRKRGLQEAAVVGVEGAEEDYADVVAALDRSPIARLEI